MVYFDGNLFITDDMVINEYLYGGAKPDELIRRLNEMVPVIEATIKNDRRFKEAVSKETAENAHFYFEVEEENDDELAWIDIRFQIRGTGFLIEYSSDYYSADESSVNNYPMYRLIEDKGRIIKVIAFEATGGACTNPKTMENGICGTYLEKIVKEILADSIYRI